jgi:hypothetical protein
MRLVSLLVVAVFLNFPTNTSGPKIDSEQTEISRSGTDFLKLCSSVESEVDNNPLHIHNQAACLGWVEGFHDGFTVHDELLNVPRRDRMACMPQGVTTIRTIRVIKKYIADNPEKAHRPTRYVASLALAGAFPCRAGR